IGTLKDNLYFRLDLREGFPGEGFPRRIEHRAVLARDFGSNGLWVLLEARLGVVDRPRGEVWFGGMDRTRLEFRRGMDVLARLDARAAGSTAAGFALGVGSGHSAANELDQFQVQCCDGESC